MSLPPSSFADNFRDIVVPKLRALIVQRAHDFAMGVVTYPDIIAEVMAEAHRRGAGYLSEDHFDALHDGILTTTANEIDAAEQSQAEADALIQRLLREPSRDAIRHAIRTFLAG